MKRKITLFVLLFVCSLFLSMSFACSSDNKKSIKILSEDKIVEYNSMYEVPKAIIVDKSGKEVEGVISIKVTDPLGAIVATSYTKIQCRILGDYVFTYSAKGVDTVVRKIKCGDYSAPVVTLGNYKGGGYVNEEISLPDLIYTDSSDIDYDLTTLDLYYDNEGSLEPVFYNELLNKFTPTKVGVYKLVSHAVDVLGNVADDIWDMNIVEKNSISFHYGVWKDGFFGGIDFGNYITNSRISENTKVDAETTIDGYYKIKANKEILSAGFKYDLDSDKMKTATSIVYYIKTSIPLNLIYFAEGEMNTVEYPPIGGVEISSISSDYVYDGWTRIEISKEVVSNIGIYCFAIEDGKGDWIQEGDEIMFSEPIYLEGTRKGFSWYYGIWADGYIGGLDYLGYTTYSKVTESTKVEESVSINSYHKIVVNKESLNIGFKYGYDEQVIEDATNLIYYIKTSVPLTLYTFSGEMNTVQKSPVLGIALQESEEIYDGWVKVKLNAKVAKSVGTYCFCIENGKGDWIQEDTEIFISDPIYEELDGPNFTRYYCIYDNAINNFVEGEDKDEYSTLTTIEETTTVAEGKTIESYYKIDVTNDALNFGFSYNFDKTAIKEATHVVFYVKSNVSLAMAFYDISMNSAWFYYSQIFNLDEESGNVKGIYNGWNKVYIPVETAKNVVKYGFNLVGGYKDEWIHSGAEILISDAEYETLSKDNKEYSVSYWNGDGKPWVTNSQSLSGIITKATVNENTVVAQGVTIQRYDTLTVDYGSVWTMGVLVSVDMTKVTDSGITIYMKVDPNCWFGIFNKSGDEAPLMYPIYAYWLTLTAHPYIESCDSETGWNKIVISKELLEQNNGSLLLGVQKRETPNAQIIANVPDTFANNTVWYISDIIY